MQRVRNLIRGNEEVEFPLLEVKLRRPRLHMDVIARERLCAKMDRGRRQGFTLVSAPAGFGKTTLVRQWLAQQDSTLPVAWVALDTQDNDPVRFWHYVLTACQRMCIGGERASQQEMEGSEHSCAEILNLLSGRSAFTSEHIVATLLHVFTKASGGVLVLEDYHVIVDVRIQQDLAFLLDHLPDALHIIMITRREPPFSLAKMRSQGQLCHIQASDLRFTVSEMQQFLQKTNPFVLTEQVIEQLHTRLDGWAAGLRLFSDAMQELESPQGVEQWLHTFTGSHPLLQTYFVHEVLQRVPQDIQDFILRTSVLEQFTALLCNTLAEREDCHQLLVDLEQKGLLLEVFDEDGQWYCYQPLFAEAMKVQACRLLGEKTLVYLARQACQWFAQQGKLTQAIEMALKAEDTSLAVAIIEQYTQHMYYQEFHEYRTLLRWLTQIPLNQVTASALLALRYAQAHVLLSPTDQLEAHTLALVKRLLTEAEVRFRQDERWLELGEVCALRALICWRQGALLQATAEARLALKHLASEQILWRCIAEHILAAEALFHGQLHLARRTFQQTRALGQKLFGQTEHSLLDWTWGRILLTRTASAHLAWTCLQQGELRLAAEQYRQIVKETSQFHGHADRVHALLSLAWIAYEWNDLDQATEFAQQATSVGEHHNLALGVLLRARIQQARGETAAALKLLTELQAQQHQLLPHLERSVLATQASIHLAVGDVALVQRWADTYTYYGPKELPRFQYEKEILLKARLQLALNHVSQAATELEFLLTDMAENEYSRNKLEVYVLLALTEAAREEKVKAYKHIQTVLALTEAEGYQRLFLDEGEPMAELLRECSAIMQESSIHSYIQQLLRTFDVACSLRKSSAQILSPQEMRVLRLLAHGNLAPQIAQQLVVSVTTVRTQIQSIYRKLQVNNRVEACAVARQLNLL